MPEGEPTGIPEQQNDGEKLAGWLVPKTKDFEDIQNPRLKTEVHLLGRHGDKTIVTPERVLHSLMRIENLISEGEIPQEEAKEWIDRIVEKYETLVGESGGPAYGPKLRLEELSRELGERDLGPIPPNEMVATFEQGRLGIYKRFWEKKVQFLDIKDEKARETWALLNMEAFNHDIIANPHERWKGVIDFWLTDLRDATRLLSTEERKASREGISETEKLIKAMMAISASARAMEVTSGSTGTYAMIMTPGREGPNLDKGDEWEDFLLHGNPEKLELVINNSLVRFFYLRLLWDAGFKPPHEWNVQENLVPKPLEYKQIDQLPLPKLEDARDRGQNPLAGFLTKKGDEREIDGKKVIRKGFDGYIEYLLVDDPEVRGFKKKRLAEGVDEVVLWSAAKLACDAFLVDKYTRWEFLVTEVEKRTNEPGYDAGEWNRLIPKIGWGGNPLTAMIQPTFLPRHIKRVWFGDDRVVLDLVDQAFHPPEAYVEESDNLVNPYYLERPLVPSMVVDYKSYVRYNDALWRFLGGSMGQEIPIWTPKTFQEDGLPKIASLLDQAFVVGKNKELKGLMMARIVEAKSKATAAISHKPSLREDLGIILDPENREMPFLEVRKELWGPDFRARSGFLVKLASGELKFIFEIKPEIETDKKKKREQPFVVSQPAVTALQRAYVTLLTNDQTISGRQRNLILNSLGIFGDLARGYSATFGKK